MGDEALSVRGCLSDGTAYESVIDGDDELGQPYSHAAAQSGAAAADDDGVDSEGAWWARLRADDGRLLLSRHRGNFPSELEWRWA